MIRSNKNIIYLLISLFTCVACTNETLVGPTVEEGVPVTATLSFRTTNPVKIETRATDIREDNKVNSLAIFIFKTNGEKVGDTHFFTSDELSSGSISIKTSSGERCIYAVANYENSLFDLKSDLDGISRFNDLKGLSTKLLQTSISVLDGEFLMSGCVVPSGETYDYTSDKTTCTISPTGVVNGNIQLKHVMAAVNFKVKCTADGATFIPSNWQVKKLPLYTNIFEQANDYQTDKAANYFNSKANVDFTKDAEDYSTFSFLMMENRKAPKGFAANRDEREKTSGTSTSAEDFIVANDNSTYLVLHGTYEGISGQTVNNVSGDKYVKAQVTYYIHLGLWQENGATDYTNFDIFRNNCYTYTVKVAGVDNLIVEVEKEGAENETWGGDGDMFLSAQSVRTFDAHFETTVISFQKKQIQDLIDEYKEEGKSDLKMFKDKFLILAATPRNNFVSDQTDLNWVTYRRNPKDVTTFAKYKDASDLNYGNPLDADGFKEDLFNAASDPDYEPDDSIRYTCFIDEYYYGDQNGNYDNNLPLEDFINTKPRTIQISTYFKKNDQSPSTVSMAAYTFSQRPIYTVYDLDYLKEGGNGWGLEWSQEEENLPIKGGFTDKNSFAQGRSNTKYFIDETGNEWDSYIDYMSNDLQSNLKYAEFACLTRNRDLNGDGIINANELRWYLPSVKQYLGFIIGEDVLPKEARLYNRGDKVHNSNYAYMSSTIYGPKYYVLLAYEGTSFGYYDIGNRPYRCVRNLSNVTREVDNFVKLSNEYDGGYDDRTAYLYSFERLNSKAKRNNVSGSLTPDHNTFDEENRLPEAFAVSEYYENEDDDSFNASSVSLNNPCDKVMKEKGWRLPNQRELAIIAYNKIKDPDGLDISHSYFSCTKSADDNEYCGYNHFLKSMTMWKGGTSSVEGWNGGNHPETHPVGFRCIKDK